jgi:hypothetical protein
LAILALLPITTARAQQVRVVAVAPAAATLPQAAVEELTTLTGAAPLQASPFSITWTNTPDDPSRNTLNLELTPSASFAGERALWVLLTVGGTLTRSTAAGTTTWQVTQSNFGTTMAHAEYTQEIGRLTLLLPLAFAPHVAASAASVHALLLVPCRLQGNRISCGAPRIAFDAKVRRNFPQESKPEEVLPTRLESVEEAAPEAKNSTVEPEYPIPPFQMSCCFKDSGIIGVCTMTCTGTCQTGCPEQCDECYDHECVNCNELSCSPCRT